MPALCRHFFGFFLHGVAPWCDDEKASLLAFKAFFKTNGFLAWKLLNCFSHP